MTTVFADAFYWFAVLNRRDEFHDVVKRHAGSFRGSILTTQWVLAEVADALAGSKARELVGPFFQQLADNDAVTIIDASATCFVAESNSTLIGRIKVGRLPTAHRLSL